jgi:WD40 repeat protein
MSQNQNSKDFESQPFNQQQSLGDVGIQGDDNILNVIQAEIVTLTQTKIIQISVDEIKTRELITTSPYKGLKKFEPEDTDRFFGRDQFIGGLVNDLEHTSFILLLGASGSGKSSTVRAGLMPWLQQKWGKHFVGLMFTPDRDPFESLYGSLLSRGYSQSQAQMAKAGKTETLSQVVKTLKPSETFWLVFIDQFEELFTVSEDDKRDRFIDSLIKLSQTSPTSVKIVATMRADFLDRLSPYPRLVKVTDRHRPMIAEMQADELRLEIEQPAAHHGVVFETGLVEEIIKEVQGQAGCLPLLQYTLDLLWESEVQDGGIHDRTLNITSYRRLGGVRGALQQRVDQIYGALSKAEQLAAQRIFLKLVEIGGDAESGTEWKSVRRRASLTEFQDEEAKVLVRLINEMLLVSDRPSPNQDSTVEIAHEVLLTSWTTLNIWIQENRRAIALRNRLNNDVKLWLLKKKQDFRAAEHELWSGAKLERVIELDQDSTFTQVMGGFNSEAKEFIAQSQELLNRQRRRTITGLSTFSTVVGFLLLAALYQLQQVQRQRVEQLAANAEALLATNPVEAEANAIAAIGSSKNWFIQFPDRPQFRPAEGSVLDVIQGNWERNHLLNENRVWSVAFSPDGQWIAYSGGKDHAIRLWDAKTGQLIGQPLKGHEDEVWSVAFSPDGQRIASGSADKTIRLWNTKTGQPIGQPLKGHEALVISVAFSPDGQRIASGSADRTIRLWDAKTGQPIGQPLKGHENTVWSVAFSPDSQRIVSGSEDKTVRLWDAKTGQPIGQPLRGHEALVNSVAFSPDGEQIASGGRDRTIRLWDAKTDQPIGYPLQGHEDEVWSIAFSPDSHQIVSGSKDRTIRLWDAKTGQPIGQPLKGHEDIVDSVAFSPDGQRIVSGSWDSSVRIWDAKTSQLTGNPLKGNAAEVWSAAFSPDGQRIVSGSSDKTVRLWDAKTGQLIGQPLKGHTQSVNSVASSPDGQRMASGSSDKTVRLWDAKTGQSIGQPLKGHEAEITSVAFSPDGQRIVSGSNDRTMRLWDAKTGQSIGQPLKGHEASVLSATFSPDGQQIVSGSADRTIRLWDAKTGQPIGQPLKGHESTVTFVAFSPDGQWIASGSADKTIRLWNAKTGQPIGQPLKGHENTVWSVAFSPDGQRIVSGSFDRTVRLWDAKTGQPIGQPLKRHGGEVLAVAFSPNGQQIVSGGNDTTVRLWNASPKYWLQTACQQLQYHPILTNPTTDIAREAQKTCQRYVWSKESGMQTP